MSPEIVCLVEEMFVVFLSLALLSVFMLVGRQTYTERRHHSGLLGLFSAAN